MRTILPSRASRLMGVYLLCLLPASAGTAASSSLVSKDLLDHAGLDVAWQVTLPIENNEHLDTMVILEDRLYVRSSRNYMWSLERDTGRTVFAQSIAPSGFLLVGWSVWKDRLITVINNQIIEFDKNTGIQQRASDLALGIVAPIARNSQFFYIPGADRRLHTFRAKDMVHIYDASIAHDPMITSVLADEDTAIIGTDAGNLAGIAADTPKKLWQFDVPGAVAGAVIRDGESFYFASKDTSVYRVDRSGPTQVHFVWRYQAEAILDREPRVTSGAIYQYSLYRGLSAIDKQRGTALWVLPEGLDLLAEAGNRAYVLSKNKTMAVMDNAAGKQLYSVNIGAVTKYTTNTTDGRICLADDRGHVVCLQGGR